MKEFVELRAKTYAYLTDDESEKKKAKGTKKCVIKRELRFRNYVDCLFKDKTILKLQQRFESDCHDVYTEQINKTALSSNDDKWYGKNDFKVCEKEMMIGKDLFVEN